MVALNCWEVKVCGREPGGVKVAELGVCPAAVEARVDGVNGGKNGGRACWAVSGTLCGGQVQAVFATKVNTCLRCDFYRDVGRDEGAGYTTAKEILAMLARPQG